MGFDNLKNVLALLLLHPNFPALKKGNELYVANSINMPLWEEYSTKWNNRFPQPLFSCGPVLLWTLCWSNSCPSTKLPVKGLDHRSSSHCCGSRCDGAWARATNRTGTSSSRVLSIVSGGGKKAAAEFPGSSCCLGRQGLWPTYQ